MPRWALGAALGVFALQCAAFHGVRKDDAFITYRYAQNLVLGRGLVFNPGEHIMGSTSPGHVLLSALTYAIVGKSWLPSAMACWGCAGWTTQALAAGVLLQRVLSRPMAWLVALAVALGGACSAEFVSLETNWVAALLLWSFEFAIAQRWSRCAATLAAAVIFRPDMYLAVLLLGGVCLWQARAQVPRALLLFAALTAPWYVFAWSYFGRVIPQSASAKYQRTAWLEYAVFEFKHPAGAASPFGQGFAIVLTIWLLAAFGGVVLARRDRRFLLLPIYVVLHLTAYFYLRPFKHAWHLYPVALLVVMLASAGVCAICERPRVQALRSLRFVPIALLALAYLVRTTGFARGHADNYWFGARDRAYREIAAYLHAHARPNDVVASVEVGTIAYYSDLTMYDWGALITPHPVLRPTTPRLSWTVVDKLFQDHFAVDMTPVRQFDVGDFNANVYSFDLIGAAVASLVAQRHGDLTETARLPRASVDHELADLAQALDQSGQRIDVFLQARFAKR